MNTPLRRSNGLEATEALSGTQPQSPPAAARETRPPESGTPIGLLGGYELLEEIGRGGMGVVYRARQRSLNRLVAVKTIRSGDFASSQELRRFLAEAEAAATLVHPGIVPVHEVGEDTGRVFFSMGFVDGGSLADLVAERPLASLEAAALLRQVCDAVHYAHEQGVVHRDLKPANILLDRDRRPLVTDFGLAKRLDGSSDLTATGQILGTPGYMPPEQARGDLTGISPRSDVYALGAVLYRLITGRPPFQGASTIETVQDVLNRDPIAPRQLVPTIPRDLETICLKCLEKAPAARYESARALAEELARFERHDPILARPLSRLGRGWRWCRKYPATAAAIAIAVTALIGGTAFSTYFAILAANRATRLSGLVVDLRKETTRANQSARVAEENAQLASEQAELALSTLRKTVFDIQRKLKNVPATQEVRRSMLSSALAGLREVAASYERGGSIDRTTMAVHSELGGLFEEVGDEAGLGGTALALKEYRLALDIAEKRRDANPNDPDVLDDLAVSQQRLGDVLARTGSLREAVRQMESAVEVGEKLARLTPEDDDVQRTLAVSLTFLGGYLLDSGQPDGAMRCFQRALAINEARLAQVPNDAERLDLVSSSLIQVGTVYREAREPGKALPYCERALEFARQAFALSKDTHGARRRLGITCNVLANVYRQVGQVEKAKPLVLEDLEYSRAIAAADPASLPDQANLAISLQNFGEMLRQEEKPQEALDYYRQAIEIRERLLQRDPGNTDYLDYLANALAKTAEIFMEDLGQIERAAEYLERELKLLDPLVAQEPTNTEYQRTLTTCCNLLSTVYQQQGRYAEAVALTRRDLELSKRLLELEPNNPQRQFEMVVSYHTLGEIQYAMREFSAASQAYSAALKIVTDHPEADPEQAASPVTFQHRILLCEHAAKVLETRQVPAEVYPSARKDLWQLLNRYLNERGEFQAAAELGAKIEQITDVPDPEQYPIAAAECYVRSLQALLAAAGKNTLSAEQAAARDKFRSEALRLFQLSIERGFRDAARVTSEPGWDPLRDAPQYQELLRRISQP